MPRLPTWAKILGAVVLFAVLFGAAHFLLWLDKISAAPGGLN